MRMPLAVVGLGICLAACPLLTANAVTAAIATSSLPWLLAQATVAPTGMDDAQKPMSPQERMRRRFPQPVRVGDLIGLPVLDYDSSTIGIVRQVVRTPQDKIKLIVSYGGWFGWGTRPVAVPIEVVGIMGRQLASLDMPPSAYKSAPTWHAKDATVLSNDDVIQVALARS